MALPCDVASVRHIQGRVTCLIQLDQIASHKHIDCIINLAGEPLAESRWSPERKQHFLQSRLNTTDALLSFVQRLEHKPTTLLSGSAVGYYGHWQDEELDEASPPRESFSHQLCDQWEQRAQQMEVFGTRVCLLRIGVVLGRDGGPLQELRRSFDLGVATQLGSGQQWMPWIHLHDVLDICAFLLDNTHISGPLNLTAPAPVTHAGFCVALKSRLTTAVVKVRVPAALVRLLVGEMADEVLLSGQRVLPGKLLDEGYAFRYPELNSALQQLTTSR